MSDKITAHFEALNYALRKSKDGVVVSFLVQPNDVNSDLLSLPVGARVMVAWSAIGDDETQIGGGERQSPVQGRVEAGSNPASIAAPEHKPRRKFAEMSLPEQCAIRCSDKQFWAFLRERYKGHVVDEPLADSMVKGLIGITSKRELSVDHVAANKWRIIEQGFKAWLLDEQYAGSIR